LLAPVVSGPVRSRRLLAPVVEWSESLQRGARGTPSQKQSLAETDLDHTLPALGMREAENDEGEIPTVPRRTYASLIAAHPLVIVRAVVEL
jgi:hypothetical protein